MNIKLIIADKEGDHYLLEINENYYRINEFTYNYFLSLCSLGDFTIINTNETSITSESVCKKIYELFKSNFDSEKNKLTEGISYNYIHFKIAGKFKPFHYKLLKNIEIIFTPSVLIIAAIAGLLCSVFFLFTNNLNFHQLYTHLSIADLLTIYFSIFIITFLHELGHSIAAIRYGVKPKEVGIGFYYFSLVFYVDLTMIWKISSLKRVVANFGGIYVQLLINLVLIGACLIFDSKITRIIFVLNCINIAFNLIPFFKSDGYWIVSDLLKITNLEQKSMKYVSLTIRKAVRREKCNNQLQEGDTFSTGTKVYGILNFLYWIILVLVITPIILNFQFSKATSPPFNFFSILWGGLFFISIYFSAKSIKQRVLTFTKY